MATVIRSLGLVAIALAFGCGGGSSTESLADLGSTPATPTIVVIFENNQYTDCNVYYNGSGGRRRLGRITGNSRGRFEVPDSPTGFRILAAYQAIGDISTGLIQANAGQTVTITSHTTGNLTFTIR